MTHDPFKLTGPTCLSFSGGRTSAYMLWRVLRANTREDIARWLVVCFANTGKEDEATLRFVRACGSHWGVAIIWLEYRSGLEDGAGMESDALPDAAHVVVSFDTASREGEPFAALIRRRRFLPNPVTRFCTSELKIRTMHRYLRTLGWTEWDQFIGIRADEQRRAAKIRARGTSTETKDETMCIPLADAGVTLQEIEAFWDTQPFKLELTTVNGKTLDGNCDLCFCNPPAQRLALIARRPESAVWWIAQEEWAASISEKPAGARFNRYGEASFAQLAQFAAEQRDLFDHDQEALACFCGD